MKLKNVYFHDAHNKDGHYETPHIMHNDEKAYFLIRCRVCGYGLCKKLSVIDKGDKQEMIFVDPCPRCLKAAAEGREVTEVPLDEIYDYIERDFDGQRNVGR